MHDQRMPTGGRIQGEGRSRHVTALEGVSFELEAGDRLGLVGPNGAGKTTLLKVLYGIFEPTCGRCLIDGRIDALFNINLGFRPEATGRRNIELRGLINGWSPSRNRGPHRGDHRIQRTRRVHRHAFQGL